MADLTTQILLELGIKGDGAVTKGLKNIANQMDDNVKKTKITTEMNQAFVKQVLKQNLALKDLGGAFKLTTKQAERYKRGLQDDEIAMIQFLHAQKKATQALKDHTNALKEDVIRTEKKRTEILKLQSQAIRDDFIRTEKRRTEVLKTQSQAIKEDFIRTEKKRTSALKVQSQAIKEDFLRTEKKRTEMVKMQTQAIKENIAFDRKKKQQIKSVSQELDLLTRRYKVEHGINVKQVVDKKLLTKAYRGESFALKQVRQELRLYEKGLLRASATGKFHVRNQRLLNNSFAVFRSKLLLGAFAIGLYARSVGRLLKLSSDLEEQISKFNVVFGESNEEAMAFAGILADRVQLSISSIIPLMAQLQDTFVPLGFARDKSAELSKVLAQLATDVGSFNNVATPDVANAFTSAIVGNHEAVRRFGIVLTEASVKQEAYKMGIAEVDSELNSQQKVLARVSILLNSTKDAQGDAIRTAGEFANVLRQFNDQWKDVAISVGNAAKPFITFILQSLKPGSAALKFYAAMLTLVALNLLRVRLAAIATIKTTKKLRIALIKSGVGAFVIALGALIAHVERYAQQQKDIDEELNEGANGLKSYNDMQRELGNILEITATNQEEAIEKANAYRESVIKNTLALSKELALLQAKTEMERQEIELGRELTEVEIRLAEHIDRVKKAREDEKKSIKDAEKAIKDKIKAMESEAKLRESQFVTILREQLNLESLSVDLAEKKGRMTKTEADDMREQIGHNQKLLGLFGDRLSITNGIANIDVTGMTQKDIEFNLELLQILQDQLGMKILLNDEDKKEHELLADKFDLYQETYGAISDMIMSHQAGIIQSQQQTAKAEIRALEKTRKYKRATTKEQKSMRNAITKDNQQAITDAFRLQQLAQVGQVWMNIGLAVARQFADMPFFAAMAAQPALLAIGGVQSAAIMAQKAPTAYAKGGDFITSRPELIQVGEAGRERVTITPVDRPESRALGSMGNVNINFSGNVLSQDFIEDEAIPMIKEAIRRGADIGVA
jgi:hypothetical protein